MRYKDSNKINFLPGKNRNYNKIKILVILFSVIAAGGITLAVHKNNSEIASSAIIVPTAIASEIPGWWYSDYFDASVCDREACKPESDPDLDQLSNQQEFFYRSNPMVSDTNKNGLTDGEDVAQNYDPSKAGKITFEEAANDDTVVGESLAFGEDVSNIIDDLTETKNVPLPDLTKFSVKTSQDNTKSGVSNYFIQIENIYKKYFPDSIDIESMVSTRNSAGVEDIQIRSGSALVEAQQLTVPTDAVIFHRYQLAMFQVISVVADIPSQEHINNLSNAKANLWYDSARNYTYLIQQSGLEAIRLTKKHDLK